MVNYNSISSTEDHYKKTVELVEDLSDGEKKSKILKQLDKLATSHKKGAKKRREYRDDRDDANTLLEHSEGKLKDAKDELQETETRLEQMTKLADDNHDAAIHQQKLADDNLKVALSQQKRANKLQGEKDLRRASIGGSSPLARQASITNAKSSGDVPKGMQTRKTF